MRLIATAMAALIATTALAEVVAPADVTYNDIGVEQSLTGAKGDPAQGREWFAERKLGNCLACHANDDLKDLPFHGEVGPPLDGAGDRWSEAELRGIVVNAKQVFGEQTIMPGFYVLETGERVMEQFQGQTVLSAEEVEDIVAYLMTLKQE